MQCDCGAPTTGDWADKHSPGCASLQGFDPATFVDLIQAQNWKNGGALVVDRNDAIALLESAFAVARRAGEIDGMRQAYASADKVFVKLSEPTDEQKRYLRDIAAASSSYDPTTIVGGPTRVE